MSHLVKSVASLNERAGVGWLENKIAGKGTQGTLLSKLLDPGRALRSNQAAGAGTGVSDALDPNALVHSKNMQTDAARSGNAAAAQAAAVAAMPRAANQDTAANAAQQQSDYLRWRRGVFANIFAGSQPNTTPVTASKSLLGT